MIDMRDIIEGCYDPETGKSYIGRCFWLHKVRIYFDRLGINYYGLGVLLIVLIVKVLHD